MQNKIVIFSHNRPTYLELLLRSLNQIFIDKNYTNFFQSIDIYYSNRSSLPYKKKIIKSLEVNFIMLPDTTSSQKINESFLNYYNSGVLDNGYLLYLDDDCILDKNRFIEFFANFKYHFLEDTIYSIYNSFSHKISKFNCKLNLYEKKSVGMLGILIPKKIIKKYIELTNISKVKPKICSDSIFVNFYTNHYGKKILVNPISIIQHIGFYGENNNPNKQDNEFSSSFFYEDNSNDKFIELFINIFAKRNGKINLNIFSRFISSLKYRLIKKSVLRRNY